MKRYQVLLFVFCLSGICAAQADTLSTGVIRGTVSDRKTGEGIPFCTVCIAELEWCEATNGFGYYAFRNLQPGRYTVTATSVGSEPGKKTVRVCAGEVARQDIALRRNGMTLGPTPVRVRPRL